MGLNIKNLEVEKSIERLAELIGTSKTEAVRQAVHEKIRREELTRADGNRWDRLRAYLEKDVWPYIDPEVRGKGISKAEREEILGYGPDGY